MWRFYAATINNVHAEDDIAVCKYCACVADGVSSTGGASASLLAGLAFTIACTDILARAPLTLDSVLTCLGVVDRETRISSVEDARRVEGVKKAYYMDCSTGGPCTEPITPEAIYRYRSRPHTKGTGGEGAPATTLLGIVGKDDRVGLVVIGDGILVSTRIGGEKEDLWVLVPQFVQGVRVGRAVVVSKGILGEPLVLVGRAPPGGVYVVATDGVKASALAKAVLATDFRRIVEKGENPAAHLLTQKGVAKGDDDASVAVAVYMP